MAIIDNKITDGDISTYGVISAPDRLTGTANENKQVFDRLIKQAVKVKMNELIDDLLAASAAGQLGASPPSGLSGSTVQAVLQSLKSYVDSTKVAKEPGKGLSQNDYTDADKALVGQIPDKADKTYVDQNMVAQIPGKGLSSNDYTDAEKELVAQIPYKAGTDNVLTKDNTAPFEPTGEYNPCTKKYADDLAFSAGAVTSVFGRAGAVVAQDGDYTPQQVGAEPAFSVLPQSKGGTGQSSLANVTVGDANKLGGVLAEFYTRSNHISNVSGVAIVDWADSQKQSSFFSCGNITDPPNASGSYNGLLIKGPSDNSCIVLFRRTASKVESQVYYRIKSSGSWSGWLKLTANSALELVSPNGSKTASLDNVGSLTVSGKVYAGGFEMDKNYYGSPIEIGQYLDMHLQGSDKDHDVRVSIDASSKLLNLANANLNGKQIGFFVTCPDPDGAIRIKKITQSAYNSLSSKDPTMVYLIVG